MKTSIKRFKRFSMLTTFKPNLKETAIRNDRKNPNSYKILTKSKNEK
ncbi:hypothetical protein [Helicobacter phage DeM53M]|nr:hypothetical protein [Helicobacter phage DeM53M]